MYTINSKIKHKKVSCPLAIFTFTYFFRIFGLSQQAIPLWRYLSISFIHEKGWASFLQSQDLYGYGLSPMCLLFLPMPPSLNLLYPPSHPISCSFCLSILPLLPSNRHQLALMSSSPHDLDSLSICYV